MYPVSQAFLDAVKGKTRKYYWTGRISTMGGEVYEFGQEDMVRGSGYISSQCCGNSEIELGTVYAAEMGVSLFSEIDRYTLENAVVELFYHLRIAGLNAGSGVLSGSGSGGSGSGGSGSGGSEPGGSGSEGGSGLYGGSGSGGSGSGGSGSGGSGLYGGYELDERFEQVIRDDGIYETIPMGIFEVSEANRRVRTLEITAYDYMLRFDKAFRMAESIGTAYDFMVLCARACQVELAQSRAEIEQMANGTLALSIYEDNDIETYRDLLSYVGQVLGGFFVINRGGKLELRKYGNQPVLIVERKQRFSSSFSDFITRYTAVSSTNMRTLIAEYYALDPDNGLTMNLGINPLIQFGLEATREQVCRNILADLAVVNYVPFDSDTIGNPAIDVGDVLAFSGGQADQSKYACVTACSVKIGGRQTIKCVGKNPRLAQAKSKNDKNIAGLMNQLGANKESGRFGIHTFTNAAAFSVRGVEMRIISMEFATAEADHAQFFGQVIVDVWPDGVGAGTGVGSGSGSGSGTGSGSGSGTDAGSGSATGDGYVDVIFTFELNNQRIPLHCPQERWHSGVHTILLYYPIEDIVPNFVNVFNVYMKCYGGTGDVNPGMCVASISGQGMGASGAWDGRIDIEEYVDRFAFGHADAGSTYLDGNGLAGGNGSSGSSAYGCLAVKAFTEEDEWQIKETMRRAMTDSFAGRIAVGGFAMPIDVTGSNS